MFQMTAVTRLQQLLRIFCPIFNSIHKQLLPVTYLGERKCLSVFLLFSFVTIVPVTADNTVRLDYLLNTSSHFSRLNLRKLLSLSKCILRYFVTVAEGTVFTSTFAWTTFICGNFPNSWAMRVSPYRQGQPCFELLGRSYKLICVNLWSGSLLNWMQWYIQRGICRPVWNRASAVFSLPHAHTHTHTRCHSSVLKTSLLGC
jgi:hypothetical protein